MHRERTGNPPTRGSRRGEAFTLIELLVVVSIIALLIAILLPALGAARASAVDAACRSNLHQAGVAQHAYAADFSQYAPLWVAGTGGPGSDFATYLDASVEDYRGTRAALNCPAADREELDRYAATDPDRAVGSYGLNPAILFPQWDYRPDRVPSPSTITLIVEQPVEQSALAYSADGVTATAQSFLDGAVWVLNERHTPERGHRHGSELSNSVMNDGHVAALDPLAMRQTGRAGFDRSDPSRSRWVWWDVEQDTMLPGGCACD